MIAYTVTAHSEDPAQRDAWIAWLRGGHMRAVIQGGAQTATLTRHDDGTTLSVRYIFPDRASFDSYERDHAPALRAEGLALFPPGPGFSLSRTIGEIIEDI